MTNKTIIVATDFSAAATNAAQYAAEMAVQMNAVLILFHVYQPLYFYADVPASLNDEDVTLNARSGLETLKETLMLQFGNSLEAELMVKVGAFYQELESVCSVIEPYAVIMGSHGNTAARQVLFGSHTVFTMRHLKYPLITVQKDTRFKKIKKVALAYDISGELDDIPAVKIMKLLKDLDASLFIISAGEQSRAQEELLLKTNRLNQLFAEPKPVFHFINTSDADEGIINFVQQHDIDLLIILPKKHSLLQQLLQKNHTRNLSMHSGIPVMALHTNQRTTAF